MPNNKHVGFVGNTLYSDKVATAIGGKFDDGYTTMRFDHLDEDVVGKDLLLDANLKALIGYKEELKAGKQVNVHLEWELTDDRRNYKYAKLLKVEVEQQ